MATEFTRDDREQVPLLTVRARRTIGADGEERVDTTVHCPVQERSVAVVECERCERYHALHFHAPTKTTSVACHTETPATEEASPEIGGPPDPATPLAQIMTTEVVCVRADVAVDEVRRIMVERGFGGVPVVDEAGKPIGIISRADVLRVDREQGETEEARRVTAKPREQEDLGLGPGFHVYEPVKLTAAEVMSPLVLSLHEGSNIGQAAALMAYEGVHRLPVVGDDGQVVGILSSLDVLRWFGRRSGYLIPPGNVRRHG